MDLLLTVAMWRGKKAARELKARNPTSEPIVGRGCVFGITAHANRIEGGHSPDGLRVESRQSG